MGHNSHSLKGRSNQPQSLASGSAAFESQCFISSINYLIVALSAQGCVQKGCFNEEVLEQGMFAYVLSQSLRQVHPTYLDL